MLLTQYFKEVRHDQAFLSKFMNKKCISYMKTICTCRWPLKHPVQASERIELESRIFISVTIKHVQNVTENSMSTILSSWCPKMTPKGVHQATSAIPNHTSHHMSLGLSKEAIIISQGVIWLASSGLTSREVNSEKSAGSQYWASPAAWESSQAKPSFSRWSWKYESPGKKLLFYTSEHAWKVWWVEFGLMLGS